jgi:hypothetical protein
MYGHALLDMPEMFEVLRAPRHTTRGARLA